MHYTVVILVDYESPAAFRVARDVWSALSRAALNSGLSGITARWESLKVGEAPPARDPAVFIFVLGQDRPETVEEIRVSENIGSSHPYGVVVATPERPSPLSGSLLYQGVERLTSGGIRAGDILPALVPVSPKTEGEAYAVRLFGRIQRTSGRQ